MLWSGLYPSQKHLAWQLCAGIIRDHLAAARGAFHMHLADPVRLHSAFGLRVRVISRHTYNFVLGWSCKATLSILTYISFYESTINADFLQLNYCRS